MPRVAAAQGVACPADSLTVADTAGVRPDVLFRATVRARTLRFDVAPDQQLRLLGCPSRDGLVMITRSNLPKPVQPGVTYVNPTISIEIRSYVKCTAAPVLRDLCSVADSTQRKRRGQ